MTVLEALRDLTRSEESKFAHTLVDLARRVELPPRPIAPPAASRSTPIVRVPRGRSRGRFVWTSATLAAGEYPPSRRVEVILAYDEQEISMTLATIRGEVLGEYPDRTAAINALIDSGKTGEFQLGGTDPEGRFRVAFVEFEAIKAPGMGRIALVYLTTRPGHRWEYMSTPLPAASGADSA